MMELTLLVCTELVVTITNISVFNVEIKNLVIEVTNDMSVSILDLPHQLLWIILENAMSPIVKQYYYYMYGHHHPAFESWTWGAFVESYNDDTRLNLLLRTGVIPAITLVSLLRSVCKSFKHCIDRNSYSQTVSYNERQLFFIKRDYIVET